VHPRRRQRRAENGARLVPASIPTEVDPMTLTPEDVQAKRFTVTRFKAGYDEEEVDAFLDEVEAELRRLLAENAELKDRLAAVTGGATHLEPPLGLAAPGAPSASPPSAAARSGGEALGPETRPFPPVPEAPSPAPVVPEPPPERPETPIQRRDDAEAAALRTLRAAQRTADGIVSEARVEAQQILNAARERGAALEQEARDRQRAALSSLAQQRQELEARIEGLRLFERDYRTRMRAYLEGQIRELDRGSVEPPQPTRAAGAAAGYPEGATPAFAPSPAGGPGAMPGGPGSADSRAGGQEWAMAPSPALQQSPGGYGQPGAHGRSGPPAGSRPGGGRVETDTGEIDEQHDGGAA
jgi:DivIVA domain-containing protein